MVIVCYVLFKIRQQSRDESRAEFSPQGAMIFFSGGAGMAGVGMLSCDFVDTLWFLYGHVYGHLVLFSCYSM